MNLRATNGDATLASLTRFTEVENLFRKLLPFLTQAQQGEFTNVQQNAASMLTLSAYMVGSDFYKPRVDFFYDKDFSTSNQQTEASRALMYLGEPLADGVTKRDDIMAKQQEWWEKAEIPEKIKEATKDTDIDVLYLAGFYIWKEILNILIWDGIKAMLSVYLVFVFMWVQTGSLTIAAAGMMEIMFSIPLSFFIYRYIFRLKFFAALNVMSLYIVLAVGADDVFVFFDAYKQSGRMPDVCVSLESRMDWVYRRATAAIFVYSNNNEQLQ